MVQPHDPQKQTDSKVFVNNTRLPVGSVDLYYRKEGALDFTRICEAEFPSPWAGQEWVDLFKTLTPEEQSSPDTVRVELLDNVTDEYVIAFQGIITGVRNSANGGDRRWEFRAEGVGHLLSNIPASTKFSETSATQPLKYVVQELNERVPFDVTILTTDESQVQDPVTVTPVSSLFNPTAGVASKLEEILPVDFSLINSAKTFTYGKHTLSNVISWVAEKAGLFVWFQPTQDGVGLVATKNPTARKHVAHNLGGNTALVNNNAYAELKPVNSITVKAPAKKSTESVIPFNIGEPSNNLLTVTAHHKPLLERAGGNEFHGNVHRLSDAMTKEEVMNEARRLLKKNVDETTSGDMQTLLRAPIDPYDTIEAQPACNNNIAKDYSPLTYEVSRVHHKVDASGISTTDLTVGIKTNLQEDIEIVDSWTTEA